MSVLKFDSAYHARNFVERAKTGGPVGDREPGVVACDQCARKQKDESQSGHSNRKPVMGAVVSGRTQNYSTLTR